MTFDPYNTGTFHGSNNMFSPWLGPLPLKKQRLKPWNLDRALEVYLCCIPREIIMYVANLHQDINTNGIMARHYRAKCECLNLCLPALRDLNDAGGLWFATTKSVGSMRNLCIQIICDFKQFQKDLRRKCLVWILSAKRTLGKDVAILIAKEMWKCRNQFYK